MRIGELAKRMGVRPSAIRFYESAGVLPRAWRQSGQREFDHEAELRLAVVAIAREAGFTVAEIKLLFHGFRESLPASRRWRTMAGKKMRDIDRLLIRLRSMRRLLKASMSCRCVKLEDCGRILLSRSQARRSEATLPSVHRRHSFAKRRVS